MTRKRRKPGTPPVPEQSNDGYNVGYCNPPTHTRFKPGQSGNPRGRPRGSKNFATLLDQELSSKVTVNEGGKRRNVSKRMAIIKRLVQKALEGDLRALQTLIKYLESVSATASGTHGAEPQRVLDPGDDAILADYEKHILEKAGLPVPSQGQSSPSKKETENE